MITRRIIKTVFGFAVVSALVACGGGGGSSLTGNEAAEEVAEEVVATRVVPGLGAFSAGARIELFDAATGNPIGTPSTTTDDGAAIVDLSGITTPFIVRVTGGNNVTYYDEALEADVPFGAADSLLAMVPATAAVSTSARIGVTPLTHMAAAFAGVSGNTLSVAGNTTQERVQAMVNGYARARYAIGLGLQTDLGSQVRLNPLAAPSVLSSANASSGIDLSTAGGYYGLWLAELTSESLRATLSAYQLAQALASEATALIADLNADADSDNVLNKDDNDSAAVVTQALADFRASDAAGIVFATKTNVGAGDSAFIGSCAPEAETLSLNTAFTGATSPTANLNPSDAQISQLATEITNRISAQLQGTSFKLTSREKTAGACS